MKRIRLSATQWPCWAGAILLVALLTGCESTPSEQLALNHDPGSAVVFDPVPPKSLQTSQLREVRFRRFAEPAAARVKSEWTTEPSIWPVEHPERQVISRFGPRGQREHKGMDIKAPTGTPIMAAADGTVTYAGIRSGYGLVVEIDHGGGVDTLYGHMDSMIVEPGQVVRQGEEIGTVGATGNASTPHLHYEVLIDGESYNPWLFLPAIEG